MRRLPGVRGGMVLSYRLTPLGLPPLRLEPILQELPRQTSRIVLLIHGFNVTEEEAYATYRRFCTEQERLARGAAVSNDRAFVEIDWPGGIEASKAISWAGYPLAVKQARLLGPDVAADVDQAARRLGHLSLDIVAHSLGCRLAIETIRALGEIGALGTRVTVTGIVFQAAAVDVEQLGAAADPRGLRTALLSTNCSNIHSLYSQDDIVLGDAFPGGQEAALERPGLKRPKALGYRKWNDGSAFATALHQEEILGAGHSDYWGGEGSGVPIHNAQLKVRAALGFSPPGARFLPSAQRRERPLTKLRKLPGRILKLS